jgi:hypothetical protein
MKICHVFKTFCPIWIKFCTEDWHEFVDIGAEKAILFVMGVNEITFTRVLYNGNLKVRSTVVKCVYCLTETGLSS